MMVERKNNLDAVKGTAILAVTLAHILDAVWPNKTPIQSWCYSWELAAFFVVGGFLFGYKQCEKYSFWDWCKKGLISNGWSYITFSLIYILLFRYGVKSTLSLYGIGALWFLPAYMGGSVLLWLITHNKIPNMFGGVILLSILLSEIIKNCFYDLAWDKDGEIPVVLLSRLFISASLMYIGWALHHNRDKLASFFLRYMYIKCFGFFAVGAIIAFVDPISPNLRYGYFGNPILFYVGTISTIISFCIVFDKLQIRLLIYLGKNSIKLFVLQNLIVAITFKVKSLLDVYLDNLWLLGAVVFILFIMTIVCTICYIEIIRRTPLCFLFSPLLPKKNKSERN